MRLEPDGSIQHYTACNSIGTPMGLLVVPILLLPSFLPYVKALSGGICEDFYCLVHA